MCRLATTGSVYSSLHLAYSIPNPKSLTDMRSMLTDLLNCVAQVLFDILYDVENEYIL